MRYFLSISLLILVLQAKAQLSPTYGLFFRDQYVFNPAAAGAKFYPVLALNHRQQWRGIEDAPVTNTLLFHLPVGDKVSLGGTVLNDTRGLLTTNAFDATISYRLPLSTDDHNLRFGLSAGVGMNSFDASRLDPATIADPAIASRLEASTFLRGRFGLLYNYKNFNLGFALPSLFQEQVLSASEFQEIEFNPLTQYYGFTSLKLPLSEQFAFEPLVAYRVNANGSEYEAGALVHALDLLWFGGTYKQNNGIQGVFGFTISDKLDFGYAYEMASNQVNGYANGTHELQLSIRVGKKRQPKPKEKKEKTPEPEPEEVVAVAPIVEPEAEPEQEEEVLIPVDSTQTQISPDSKLRLVIEPQPIEESTEEIEPDKDEQVVRRGQHMLELPAGHYVMIGAFKSLENAQKYSDRVFAQGYHEASFGYLSTRKYYYVWIATEANATQARQVRDDFRKMRAFNKAWYMEIKD